MISLRLSLAALLLGFAAHNPALARLPAAPVQIGMSDTEQAIPAMLPLLPMRERAEVIDAVLAERLNVPASCANRASPCGAMAREYFEEPVVATMLDAQSMHARRRTILIFTTRRRQAIERLTVSRYGLGDCSSPPGIPKQPDQWQAVAIHCPRDPATIAINTSVLAASAMA